jgi:hypothetical protein
MNNSSVSKVISVVFVFFIPSPNSDFDFLRVTYRPCLAQMRRVQFGPLFRHPHLNYRGVLLLMSTHHAKGAPPSLEETLGKFSEIS